MDRNYVFNKHYDVSLNYDANGNITQLSRNRMPTNPNSCGVLMDDLSYTYNYANSGNRLLNIEDVAEADRGFKYLSRASNYEYDLNGNLTRDFHKGYEATYNYLNLPELFSFNNGSNQINLLYDAGGTKLRKTVSGTENYVKEYCSGIEYRDGVLEAIYHEEGRVIRDGNGNFEYQYFLRDHLGNTRVMFEDANKDGEVEESEVIETNDYYPFGLRFEGNYADASNPDNDYKFSNKELNSDYGLELYDHGARWRDPTTGGTWLSVDQLTEEFTSWSPYSYSFNNPIRFSDPSGLAPEDVIITIYATSDGNTGHAGIAVSNYIKDENGNNVPDGTYTYYDLFPNGVASKKNFDQNISADFSNSGKIVTLDELTNSDVTGVEYYAPDGVIQLATDFETDELVKEELGNFQENNQNYNSAKCNCTDFVQSGVESATGENINATENIGQYSNVSTPNKLFNKTKNISNSKVIKDPGNKVNKTFLQGFTEGRFEFQQRKINARANNQ